MSLSRPRVEVCDWADATKIDFETGNVQTDEIYEILSCKDIKLHLLIILTEVSFILSFMGT